MRTIGTFGILRNQYSGLVHAHVESTYDDEDPDLIVAAAANTMGFIGIAAAASETFCIKIIK